MIFSFKSLGLALMTSVALFSGGPDATLWSRIQNNTNQELTLLITDQLVTVGSFQVGATRTNYTSLRGRTGTPRSDQLTATIPMGTSYIYFNTSAAAGIFAKYNFASHFSIGVDGCGVNFHVQLSRYGRLVTKQNITYGASDPGVKFTVKNGACMNTSAGAWLTINKIAASKARHNKPKTPAPSQDDDEQPNNSDDNSAPTPDGNTSDSNG